MSSSTLDLIFRTTDAARWGSGKGSPLRADEVDVNFWILLQLFLQLEANPVQPNQISNITSDGTAITITMADASTFGPFVLPVAEFEWRGNWTPATAYNKWDLFETTTGLFLVLQAHTSNATFNSADGNVAGAFYRLLIKYPVTMDIGFFSPGKPGTGIADGFPIFAYLFAHDAYLLANLPDSRAVADAAFTSAQSFDIQQNGDVIGTLDFGAGATLGTFSFAADVQFVKGDVLKVMKPAAIDATGASLNVTFAAIKGEIEGPSSS
jgi:hypothetical protein